MKPWGDAVEGQARALLRLSYVSSENDIARGMREIAYALLDLAREVHNRESE